MPSMIRIALSAQMRKSLASRLQQAYAASATRLVRRIHALLWLVDGKSVGEVAQTLDLGEQTIRDWLHTFLLQGLESLYYRASTGRPTKLTEAQRRELKAFVLEGPEECGYESACWTSAMIADLIRLRFKVDYHPRYVCQLLAQLGLSFQKAKFTSDHLNEHEAILWLEETWPEILRLAQEKQAIILFGDEASFAQWGSLSYTWSLKGVQPTVKTSGIRKAYRVFGLLDCLRGRLYQRGLEGKFNSETYSDFLRWLLSVAEGSIILIQDNAPYHTSGRLHDFYAEHADRLTVYQLPPYSPDLNPIESLWKKVKKDATHLRYFPLFADLIAKVDETLAKLANLPDELTALIGEYREWLPMPA
jgi:transposase